jgi:hypothetical protein
VVDTIARVAASLNKVDRRVVLADIFPGLSPVGRRKRAKPPCCDDPESPPVMPGTLSEQLAGMFGYS